MKKLAVLFVTLLALVAFASTASAQTKPSAFGGIFQPYVDGSITTAPGAPGNGQNYTVGVGLEADTRHFLFDGSGSYNSALVTANPGNGHVGLFTLQGYYKIGGHLLAGGGATAVLNTGAFTAPNFVNTAKAAANPFVGVGLQVGRFRSIASYQIPVRGAGIPEQIKFTVNNEFALNRHVRIWVPLVINSYREGTSFPSDVRVTVPQVGAGLKLLL